MAKAWPVSRMCGGSGRNVCFMQESGENYLETIYLLKDEKQHVRSIDVANKLGFSKPSISRAMGILKENGFIDIDQNGWIEFTDKGLMAAESIYERHRLITAFLMDTLDLDFETADHDACRIEHIISQKTIDKIKAMEENKKNLEKTSN